MNRLNLMIAILPSVVALLYLAIAIAYLAKRDYAWAVVWGGYSVSNIGLILIGLRTP